MKTKIVENKKNSWKPVTIQTTFETKQELAAYLMLMNSDHSVNSVIVEQLELHPKYREYFKNGVEGEFTIDFEMWCKLDKLLEE